MSARDKLTSEPEPEVICTICHAEPAVTERDGEQVGEECTDGFDWYATLTPAERADDDEAVTAYVNEPDAANPTPAPAAVNPASSGGDPIDLSRRQ